jgi:hypothetical protein
MIFVSYRRDDTAGITGRIYDKLEARFGAQELFMDVDSIPPGADFEQFVTDKVRESDVMLVVIGQNWVGHHVKSRGRRIDEATDFVRIEVELAIRSQRNIIPLLVSKADMPSESELPQSIRPLAVRQAIVVRDNPDFHRDMERVIVAIQTQLTLAKQQREQAARLQESPDSPLASPADSLASLGLLFAALLETASKEIVAAIFRTIRSMVLWAIFVGILAAGITEATGAWLVHRFPPSLPTHVAAVAIGLLSAGLVAVTIALEALRRAGITTLQLVEEEAARLDKEGLALVQNFQSNRSPE